MVKRPEGEVRIAELLGGNDWNSIPLDHQIYLYHSHRSANYIRRLSKTPHVITSGYRSQSQHAEIYAQKNAKRKMKGLPELRIPWGSFHLIGAAWDVADPRGELKDWVLSNIDILEMLGIHCENPEITSANSMPPWEKWCHFQIMPPSSGARFFDP